MRPTQVWPASSSYLTYFSFLSLKHAGLASTPGLLYLLFFLPEMLFPRMHTLTHPLQVSLKCHLDTKVFSDHPSHLPSLYPSSFSFMVFMTSSYFMYTFFFSYLFLPHYKASSMRGRPQFIMVQWFNLYSHFTDENTESQ